ncbi:MAG: RlpA family plasminogen-binding lipoprotein MPL36 [Leptospira bouyouniensis]|uniref:Probable endolytic peptidoglycan transglycosylase RlpA n=1 Tax=Leptospira bouyouniensis TaxID=2484911 RepID=A0A7I0HV91_9LEPT|nr:septal ring lytic transglycosylase RlpA family protein [Leptospira bouyouniensis]TGK53126.1 septal ring lytic transglycosylase RlpA family protein [Leptospira bouyouniensis]TGL08237.1 septal ring lytic transglycosylase RlpA family protein [Leptospira bouyouniensis]TGM87344.1 septal ring lytic transglycosylase RlpA family protein [Leptospira bouyouniensis]
MQRLILITILMWFVSCSSADATRRDYSASGDPEDIFFERSQKNKTSGANGSNDPVARSIMDDLDSKSKPTTAQTELPTKKPTTQFDEVGLSSWYGQKFQGRPTASGEPFDRMKMTGAHRTLPIGTVVKIQNLENQKEAVVRINDRGPFVDERIVDVSEKTAEILEFKDKGITKVGIKVLKKGEDELADDLDDSDLLDDAPTKPEKLTPVKPGVTKPIATGKGFTVQVGVFQEKERAIKYQETIKSEYNQTVFVTPRDGKYVVQVGDFSDRAKAESLKSKLKYDGIDCFIATR